MLRIYSRWIGETLRSSGQAEIERRAGHGIDAGLDRHRPVVDVRDDAHAVELVELPRLGGNVGGGKAQIEIGRQDTVAVLAHHMAVPVRSKR